MTKIQKLAIGAATVQLIAESDRIVMHVRSGKGFEPQSRKLWGEVCAKGGVVLDIGAYSGLFCIGAALLGCEAWAFEPMPQNVARIQENIALNGVKVEVADCVVSDINGMTEISFNDKVNGLTAGASMVKKKGYKIAVQSVTIDSLHLEDVRAIKIDVERAEPMVLRGAAETLARCRPFLLVEALGAYERAAVLEAVPGYRLKDVLDVRNMVLEPV